MTLLDVLKLARHYIKMVVAMVMVCTLAGVGVGIVKAGLGNAEYSAEAVLTISDPTATVAAGELMPLARAIATNVAAENSGNNVAISQKYDLASRTISFTAVASTEAESVEAANGAARQTADQTAALLQQMADQYRSEIQAEESTEAKELDGNVTFGLSERNRAAALEMVAFTVNDASQAIGNNGRSILLKFALAGLLGGCFLAVCVVILVDFVKKPVKDEKDLAAISAHPVLAAGNEGCVAPLLQTNVDLLDRNTGGSICLVSIKGADSEIVKENLIEYRSRLASGVRSVEGESVATDCCSSKSELISSFDYASDKVNAVLAAAKANNVVLLVKEWVDSSADVQEAVEELHLIGARVVGFVLLD